MRKILKHAIVNALGTAIYIVLVASFIYLGGEGAFGTEKSVLIPIAMLMLFVFSAAITGSLIFGRPVAWYLEGRKKDSLLLLSYTLLIFLALTALAFFALIIL